MKTLLELDDTDCRFAFGTGPYLFCGEPKQDKSSYCPHHHPICWDKSRPVSGGTARKYFGTDFARRPAA